MEEYDEYIEYLAEGTKRIEKKKEVVAIKKWY
jgi:hypothetical protein